MSTTADDHSEVASRAAAEADDALGRLVGIVERLGDGDLHLAHRDGGWTTSIVISHINVATVAWLGDLFRLRADPDLRFFYREEIGHDLTGYPPPTVAVALGQLSSTRRTVATSLASLDSDLLERTVEIPDLGTMTIAEWTPLIIGHLVMHVGQAEEILTDRDAMPAKIDAAGA